MPCTSNGLPTIAEEIIEADDLDTDTDEPPKPAPVHVVDSPKPTLNQHAFDQTDHEGPVLTIENTHNPALSAHSPPPLGPTYTMDNAGRRRSTRTSQCSPQTNFDHGSKRYEDIPPD